MKHSFISFFTLLFVAFTSPSKIYCQCLSAPTASCSGSEPILADNETLAAGITKRYNGAATSYNSLTMNGGTLIVCTDLTIDKFAMDSGTIFVQPGARFVIGNGIGYGLTLKGNSYIYNFGTLQVMRNLSLENGWATPAKPNVVINAALAYFKMQNQYFVINNANSWFVNRGKAEFHGIITDPQASAKSVCLGSGSETKMTVLYNKVKNSYFAPEASACVSVSQYSQIWDTLTTHPNINMCLGMSHITDSSCMPWGCKPSWGLASLVRGCGNCGLIMLLTNRFQAFSVQEKPSGNMLYWELEQFSTTASMEVEVSRDGRYFTTAYSLKMNTLDNAKNYSYFDADASGEIKYYRIKYVDSLRDFVDHTTIIKAGSKQPASLLIYPNPFSDKLFVSMPGKFSSVCAIIQNAQGVQISRQWFYKERLNHEIIIPTSFPAGVYFLTLIAGPNTWRQKIIKQ